jgi:hypothetical protein
VIDTDETTTVRTMHMIQAGDCLGGSTVKIACRALAKGSAVAGRRWLRLWFTKISDHYTNFQNITTSSILDRFGSDQEVQKLRDRIYLSMTYIRLSHIPSI